MNEILQKILNFIFSIGIIICFFAIGIIECQATSTNNPYNTHLNSHNFNAYNFVVTKAVINILLSVGLSVVLLFLYGFNGFDSSAYFLHQ
jgi:hypothetical protein